MKKRVAAFINNLNDRAFTELPHGHLDRTLKDKDMGFVCGALLRSSVAWLQQDRATSPSTAVSPMYRASGVLDFNAACMLLLERHYADESAVKTVSTALCRVMKIRLHAKPIRQSGGTSKVGY